MRLCLVLAELSCKACRCGRNGIEDILDFCTFFFECGYEAIRCKRNLCTGRFCTGRCGKACRRSVFGALSVERSHSVAIFHVHEVPCVPEDALLRFGRVMLEGSDCLPVALGGGRKACVREMVACVQEEMAVTECCCLNRAVVPILHKHEGKGRKFPGRYLLNRGIQVHGYLPGKGDDPFHEGNGIVFGESREFLCRGRALKGDEACEELAVARREMVLGEDIGRTIDHPGIAAGASEDILVGCFRAAEREGKDRIHMLPPEWADSVLQV